jgi:hypothetical protein
MGTRSTVKGFWRQGGNSSSNTSTPAVVPSVIVARGLSAIADAGTGTGKFLPIGAIPLSVTVKITSAISGGTSPILDVGLELSPTPDDDGLANGLDYEADTFTPIAATLAGVLLGRVLTQEAELTYGDDGVGTNNTSGAIDIFVTYVMTDDGAFAN